MCLIIIFLDPNIAATNTSNACSTEQLSSDNPLEMVDCVTTVSNSDLGTHTFLHGDWYLTITDVLYLRKFACTVEPLMEDTPA